MIVLKYNTHLPLLKYLIFQNKERKLVLKFSSHTKNSFGILEIFLRKSKKDFSNFFYILLYEISRKFMNFMNFWVSHLKSLGNRKRKGNYKNHFLTLLAKASRIQKLFLF